MDGLNAPASVGSIAWTAGVLCFAGGVSALHPRVKAKSVSKTP